MAYWCRRWNAREVRFDLYRSAVGTSSASRSPCGSASTARRGAGGSAGSRAGPLIEPLEVGPALVVDEIHELPIAAHARSPA
jgi:hypothetical protein